MSHSFSCSSYKFYCSTRKVHYDKLLVLLFLQPVHALWYFFSEAISAYCLSAIKNIEAFKKGKWSAISLGFGSNVMYFPDTLAYSIRKKKMHLVDTLLYV